MKSDDITQACEEFALGLVDMMREQNIEPHVLINTFEIAGPLGVAAQKGLIEDVIYDTALHEIRGIPIEIYRLFYAKVIDVDEDEVTERVRACLNRLISELRRKEAKDDTRTAFHRLRP